jgi:hypothetical protein
MTKKKIGDYGCLMSLLYQTISILIELCCDSMCMKLMQSAELMLVLSMSKIFTHTSG